MIYPARMPPPRTGRSAWASRAQYFAEPRCRCFRITCGTSLAHRNPHRQLISRSRIHGVRQGAPTSTRAWPEKSLQPAHPAAAENWPPNYLVVSCLDFPCKRWSVGPYAGWGTGCRVQVGVVDLFFVTAAAISVCGGSNPALCGCSLDRPLQASEALGAGSSAPEAPVVASVLVGTKAFC